MLHPSLGGDSQEWECGHASSCRQRIFVGTSLGILACNVSSMNYRGEGHLSRTAASPLKPFFCYSRHAYCSRACLFVACL